MSITVEEHTNKEISFVHTHLSLKHSKPTSRAAVFVRYTCLDIMPKNIS